MGFSRSIQVPQMHPGDPWCPPVTLGDPWWTLWTGIGPGIGAPPLRTLLARSRRAGQTDNAKNLRRCNSAFVSTGDSHQPGLKRQKPLSYELRSFYQGGGAGFGNRDSLIKTPQRVRLPSAPLVSVVGLVGCVNARRIASRHETHAITHVCSEVRGRLRRGWWGAHRHPCWSWKQPADGCATTGRWYCLPYFVAAASD